MNGKSCNRLVIFGIILFLSFNGPLILSSFAEQDGGDIQFQDTKSMPPVLFQHSKHTAAGVQCAECHPKIFKQKKGSTDAAGDLTMKALQEGKYCGTCHNGDRAFAVSKSCRKCHVK